MPIPNRDPANLKDQLEQWLRHLRKHGVTSEEMRAALETDIGSFMQHLDDDFGESLERMTRLRPGAEPWQIVREAQELAERRAVPS
jgi:hypothetical protein